jgi:hypothetical protein
MMPGGRPTDYNDEIADLICIRIACGESVVSISKDPEMPCQKTIYKWLFRHEEFVQKYARAREAQAEVYAAETIDIADDTKHDTHVTEYGDGTKRESPDTEWISRDRLRCDMRRWAASKLAPKKYGDKIVQQVTGADGGPLTVSWKKAEDT